MEQYDFDHHADRIEAMQWAAGMLQRGDLVILDTETTGLEMSAELVQLAVINRDGDVLLDTLIKPERVTEWPDAARIHGITPEMVTDAPTFADVHPQLCEVLQDKYLVIFNFDYDWRLIVSLCKERDLPVPMGHLDDSCAMHWYSQYVGDWNDYYGNYRWQRLPGGDHSALGDCRATLAVIREMAEE